MVVYLDAKSDIAFKKLFGNIAHKEVLISFLNSVLERVGGSRIIDVVINDPTNVPDTPLSKMSIVDVRCTDQSGNQYIVEMQVVPQKYYAARAQYYSSLALGRQLSFGQGYNELVPVIFVGILDFELFENPKYLTHHFILDGETYVRELHHLEFHFIELDKFYKQEAELQTTLDKWIYLLKYSGIMQSAPESFKEQELEVALGVLAQSNWSVKELEAYDRYLDAMRSAVGQLEMAEALGLARGEARGEARAKEQLALNALKVGLDIVTVSQIIGLSIEQVQELQKKSSV